MKGTISQLHEGGRTNKTSDQRPVVFLNSGYQVLNYIINDRLKRIVEQTDVLEPGQGEGRQGRSVNIKKPKKAFCYALIPQTRKACLSSRHRLQKRLQCNVAGSPLARDEHVSYARRWLTGADSNLRQQEIERGSHAYRASKLGPVER